MMFPLASALAIKLSVGLNAIAVTDFFCFIVNIIFELLIFNMMISPDLKQTATISMRGVGRAVYILLSSAII